MRYCIGEYFLMPTTRQFFPLMDHTYVFSVSKLAVNCCYYLFMHFLNLGTMFMLYFYCQGF